MKISLYPRLAWDGIRKNRRMSVPYLLTCICMVAMYYILNFLASPTALALIPRGKSSVETILNLGKYVVLLFSLVFLFYTHSFLIRRRQREFGLYNVLGMDKRNLARIITWESLITFTLALVGGLIAGLVFSGCRLTRTNSLLLCRHLRADLAVCSYSHISQQRCHPDKSRKRWRKTAQRQLGAGRAGYCYPDCGILAGGFD